LERVAEKAAEGGNLGRTASEVNPRVRAPALALLFRTHIDVCTTRVNTVVFVIPFPVEVSES
jgi:hypothetical protein